MKRIAIIITILISIYIIANFFASIYTQLHKKDILTQAQNELLREQEENKKLKAQLTQVQSSQFIQTQARNKLFMVRPGENPLILPQPPTSTPTLAPKKITQPFYQPVLSIWSGIWSQATERISDTLKKL